MSELKTRGVPRKNDQPRSGVCGTWCQGRLSQGELGTLVWMILR